MYWANAALFSPEQEAVFKILPSMQVPLAVAGKIAYAPWQS